jgi:uncharacterized protein (PEP-CTERM system associated)
LQLGSRHLQKTLGVTVLLSLSMPGTALDWKVAPSVGASTILTDNATQAANGDGAFIVSVTPGIVVRSEGSRRVQAQLDYGLSAIERFGDGSTNNSDDLTHRLNATGKAEVAEDLFFIEGNAYVTQALSSILGAPGDASLDTGNRTTVGTYSLSPYLTRRFGTFGNGTLRYTRSGAIFEDSTGGDIGSNALQANFASGSQFNDLSWGLNYSLRDASTQGGRDTQFESYGATAAYALTRKFRLTGSVGYDKNDFVAAPGTKTEGDYWTAGFDWSPSRRTSLNASFGQRYYGDNYAFGFTHRTNYSQWSVRYSEDVSDISEQILNFSGVIYWNCNGVLRQTLNSFEPPAPECRLAGLGVNTGLASGVYLLKSLHGGVTWTKGKLGGSVNVHDSRRSYQEVAGEQEDQTRGISGSLSYRLAPHSTVTASLGYDNSQVPAGLTSGSITPGIARDDDIYTASVGISHQFQPKLNGNLVFRHQQRESNDSAQDFTENSLTATVAMRF